MFRQFTAKKRLTLFAIITILTIFIPSLIYATSIDLTEEAIHVKEGFHLSWTSQIPSDQDKSWTIVPGNKEKRPVIIAKLNLKNIPKYEPFNFTKHPPRSFTLLTKFDLQKDDIDGAALGLLIGRIANNWAIYLNGKLLINEIYINKNGTLDRYKETKNVVLELRRKDLKDGQNILSFHIVGDPSDYITGLSLASPYKIDKYIKLIKGVKNKEYISLLIISAYLFAGIYHFMLFLYRKSEKDNLYFSLSIIMFAIYMFCRTTLIYSIPIDTLIIKKIEYISLFTLAPLLLSFFDALVYKKHSRVVTGYGVCCYILTAINFLFFWETREILLQIWQYSVMLAAIYALIFQIIYPSYRIFNNKRISIIKENRIISWISNIIYIIFKTNPGNILIGWSLVCVSVFIDLKTFRAGNPTLIVQYAFLFVVLGAAGILANRFYRIHNKLERLNISLEEKVKQRTIQLNQNLKLLKKQNAQILKQEATLIQQEKLVTLGDMTASIAHEINTPLLALTIGFNKFINYVDILRNNYISNKKSEADQYFLSSHNGYSIDIDLLRGALEQIRKQIQNMKSFIKFQDSSKKFSINKELNITISIMNYKILSNIEVIKTYADDLPPVNGNAAQINQVFMNLIKNAIEAKKEKTKSILKITTYESNGYVCVDFEDNGKGMSSQTIENLLHDKYIPKENGTGIGISLCKEIIDNHNGQILIESELEIGSKIIIMLPITSTETN